jgi:hypothetical protein
MNKLRMFLVRYRLISSALVLAFMLAALTLSPPKASAFFCEAPQCGQGCVNWTAGGGCSDCQFCCVCGPDDYTCTKINDRTCEFTMN